MESILDRVTRRPIPSRSAIDANFVTTRRDFLTQVGRAGGFGATYLIMRSLGLLPVPPSEASESCTCRRDRATGKTVVILGAGIAGLSRSGNSRRQATTAWFSKPGSRPGGRNWTIRSGTRVEMTTEPRKAVFRRRQLFQRGPRSLPSQHVTMLGLPVANSACLSKWK